nr:unnamed protein product [Callosobruchus analis]
MSRRTPTTPVFGKYANSCVLCKYISFVAPLPFSSLSISVYLVSIKDSRVVSAAAFVVLNDCYRKINPHQARKAKRKRRWRITAFNRNRDR